MRCNMPITLKERDPETGLALQVPCGKCKNCLKKRATNWAFRLAQEMDNHIYHHFVTLTYSDENLVLGEDYPTLYKPHLTNYIKRVRKRNPYPIKYYAVGEYGEKYKRPHYHLIIYGAKEQILVDEWRDVETDTPMGNIQVDKVTDASIRYVTNYCVKPRNYRPGVEKEFSVMSKGIGLNYMTYNIMKWHNENLHNFVMKGPQRLPMPRYYKDKIFSPTGRIKLAKKNRQLTELLTEKEGFWNYKIRTENAAALDYIQFQTHKKLGIL